MDSRYVFHLLGFCCASRKLLSRSQDKSYFELTYFPKIFVAIEKHILHISIAVCLETVVVNKILTLDMLDNLFRDDLVQKLARVAVALRECSKGLDAYYSDLKGKKEGSSCFPSPTLVPLIGSELLTKGAFDNSSTFCGLKIEGHLSPKGQMEEPIPNPSPADMRHNLFLATLDGNGEKVVVKLVKRYSKEAHKHLANKGLAPKLFLCQRVIGNLIVVVMEHVSGCLLNEVPGSLAAESQLLVFKSLKRATEELESEDFVHGDLRTPNIVVDPNSDVKVIDFDWAAKHDQGHYPRTINTDELRAEWHGDVGPMKKMKLEHDKFAVFKVLKPKFLRGLRDECPS